MQRIPEPLERNECLRARFIYQDRDICFDAVDDISHEGMETVEQIVTIMDNYEFDTEVLVASVRHPEHVLQAALMGADICTIPYKVYNQLVKHPLTDIGLARFLADAKKVPR